MLSKRGAGLWECAFKNRCRVRGMCQQKEVQGYGNVPSKRGVGYGNSPAVIESWLGDVPSKRGAWLGEYASRNRVMVREMCFQSERQG